MLPSQTTDSHHITRSDWLNTPQGDPRGYIQSQQLKELWFHTGTICNLSCPFCLEGSKPGDDRLNKMTLADVRPFIDEAVLMGVEKFSFTGGEPFVVPEFVRILDYALDHRPCLVLTNGTKPIQMRFEELQSLLKKKNSLNFRVSLDYPDPRKHDQGRGEGNFFLALETLGKVHAAGFGVSIARQRAPKENTARVDHAYQRYFKKYNIPRDTLIVSFPDFLTPGAMSDVPHITEDCMRQYHTEESRSAFMCAYSRMIVKKNGRMRVYACTLVDDDDDYDFGGQLQESMNVRVMLKHHRCYSCFAFGASCSEGRG